MKAYLFSALLHFSFVALLFLVAASPQKTYFPGKVEQVFLVAAVPTSIASVGAPFMEPAGRMNATPTFNSEMPTETIPIKPEPDLAEKLKTRLTGITSDAWNHKAAARNEAGQGQAGRSSAPDSQGVPGGGNLTAGRVEESGQASAAGSAQVESEAGFPDGWYLALLSRRLTERWNPVREGIAAVKREVVVLFTITRDGRIKEITLTRTSGNPKFDRSGMTAVAECDFLPPLPASWGKDSLQVSVRFREK